MPTDGPQSPPVSFRDLSDAFEFVSSSELGEFEAYICRRTGRIIFVSEDLGMEEGEEPLPEDPDPAEYLPVPTRRDLDLGKRLALSFAREHLPGEYDEVARIFSRRGAYRQFRRLLIDTRALDAWYAFEAKANDAALRNWCAEVGVTLIDDPKPTP